MRAYLTREAGVAAGRSSTRSSAEAEALAEHVRAGCRALPDPTPRSLFDHVYVDMPDELREQRAEFVAYVDSARR